MAPFNHSSNEIIHDSHGYGVGSGVAHPPLSPASMRWNSNGGSRIDDLNSLKWIHLLQ